MENFQAGESLGSLGELISLKEIILKQINDLNGQDEGESYLWILNIPDGIEED